MKVLIIHQFFWAHYKAAIYNELQLNFNKSKTNELLVLQTSISEISRAKLGTPDPKIHQYNYKVLFNKYYENISNLNRFRKMLFWLIKFKPDVVNVAGYYEPAMNSIIFVCKLLKIKVIISSDSTEVDNPNLNWKEKIKKYIINQGDGFFCYGTKSAEYILKFGIEPSKILIKNNAVNNQKISEIYQSAIANRNSTKETLNLKFKYYFIFVGRLIKFKNVDNLLLAFSKISDPDWGIIILGNGDQENELKQFVNHQKMPNVSFIDGKQWYQVPEYMALADVFILPSFSEPWGLVVNEAMACGMPVLVSNTCGCACDLVSENQNGYTFDPFDVNDMTKKLNLMVNNTQQLEKFGKESKEIIERFSPKNVANQMYEGFIKVLNEGK